MALITVVATESMAITTVMPLVESDLGDLWLYGWAFSAFFLGDLIGIVVGGRSADRVHPVAPLLVGLAVFAAGLVVGGVAPSMLVLVLGRFLQGIGAGAVPAVAYVCVARGFAVEERPRIFAIMSTAWILPSLLAPLVASAVAEAIGWRWVFLGLVPVTVASGLLAVLSLRSLTAPDSPHAGRTPLGRVVVLVLGAALLLGGLSSASPWMVALLVAAGLGVGLPALHGLLPRGTARAARGLPAAVLIRGILTFSFFSANAYVSLAVTSARGSTTFVAGAALAVGSLTWTVGAWTQARCYPTWGAARLERTAASVLVVGMLLMLASLVESVPLGVWFVATSVAGLGMGLGYAPLSNVTLAAAEPGREGAASSALQLSDVLGIALGTGIGGAIVNAGSRWELEPAVAIGAVFGLSAAGAVLVAVLAGRLRVAATPGRPGGSGESGGPGRSGGPGESGAPDRVGGQSDAPPGGATRPDPSDVPSSSAVRSSRS